MDGRHLEYNHIERKGIDYNINDIGISDDQPTFGFVISKIICPQKTHQSNIWVPTPNTSSKFKYIHK